MILTPRITEINQANHISNLAIMAWFEEARSNISQLLNNDINGIKFTSVIARIDCQFKNEVFYGSNVEIKTVITTVGNSSITVNQKAFQKNTLVAENTVVLVYVNLHKKCTAPITDKLRKSLLDYV